MSTRRGLVAVAALAGATLAVSTGVGLDRVLVPRLTGDSEPVSVRAQSDPETGQRPRAVTGTSSAPTPTSAAPAAGPEEESTPRMRALQGPRRKSSPSPTPTDEGGSGGGGTETPPGASGPEGTVVSLTNEERAKAGCAALKVDDRLTTAARRHSADMAANNYFSHTSLNRDTFADRIKAAGYPQPGAENIAKGYPTAAAVMQGWMNSSGHRANILNCRLKAIGVGMADGPGGPLWTQDFGWV
jgi:uncharacterized protein YkwD